MTTISPWPQGPIRSLLRGWSAPPGIYIIRSVSNVLQKLSRYRIEPWAKPFSDSPFPEILFFSPSISWHAFKIYRTGTEPSRSRRNYRLFWGEEYALHQISITALLIHTCPLLSTSRFRYTFGCFFSLRQTCLWRRMKASALCTRRAAWRQRGIKEAAIFFFLFLFCFVLVVSNLAGRPWNSVGVCWGERRENGEKNSDWRKSCFETKNKEHF